MFVNFQIDAGSLIFTTDACLKQINDNLKEYILTGPNLIGNLLSFAYSNINILTINVRFGSLHSGIKGLGDREGSEVAFKHSLTYLKNLFKVSHCE